MATFIMFLSLVGDWLLYTFPFYQGLMELGEYDEIMRNYGRVSKKRQGISPWWWIFPIVKIHKEKQRAVGILAELSKTHRSRKQIMGFINKATAWFYVALAGWLKMIASFYELQEELKQDNNFLIFVCGVVLLTGAGIFNAVVRVTYHHKDKLEIKLKTIHRINRTKRK